MKETVKALSLKAVGKLELVDLPKPQPADDEVVVRVAYAGVCGSDIPRVFDKGTYHFPTVIGHEFAGTVEFDPAGELNGKKVAVFPLLPCFNCDECKAKRYVRCHGYDYYGSRRDGGMTELIAIKKWNLVPVPENVSLQAAAMCEPSAVAIHAADALPAVKGKRVLVTGAGPIGLLAAQRLASLGATPVLHDIDEKKLEFARGLGLAAFEGGECDLAVEGTGAGAALATIVRSIAAGGTIILLGNPGRDVALAPADYQTILRKELVLRGSWNSSYKAEKNDWVTALEAMKDGSITPDKLVTHVVPLSEAVEAFDMMHERREFYVKVLIKP